MISLRKLWLSLTDITMLPPELSYCSNLTDLKVSPHPGDDIRANGTSQRWTPP